MVKTAFTSEQIWLIFIRQRSPVNSDTWFASDRWSNGVAFGTATVLLASVTHCNVSSRGSFFGNLKLLPGVYYPTWTSICSSFCYWKGYSSCKKITSLVTCFSDIHRRSSDVISASVAPVLPFCSLHSVELVLPALGQALKNVRKVFHSKSKFVFVYSGQIRLPPRHLKGAAVWCHTTMAAPTGRG